MKRVTKLLLLTVIAVSICCALVFISSGNSDEIVGPEATTHVSFVVYDQDGHAVLEANGLTTGTDPKGNKVYGFVSFKDAVNAAQDGYTIKMVNDYEEGVPKTNASLNVKKTLTLNLNGYTWASSWNSTPTAAIVYQRIAPTNGCTLTVTGNGNVRTASSFIGLTSSGCAVIDPGEGNTINFFAIPGYKYEADGDNGYKVLESTFKGDPMLKIGGNKGNDGANIVIRGSITYTAENTGCNFIGAYEGASVIVEDANMSVDLSDSLNRSVFTHLSLSLSANPNGGYYSQDAWPTYTAPTFTIKNSIIDSPYGKFMDLTPAKETLSDFAKENGLIATYAHRDKVTIDNTVIDLNGDGEGVAADFVMTAELFAEIRITDSEIISDSQTVFNFNTQDIIPNVVVLLKDTTIDTTAHSSKNQIIFNKGATVIVDGGFLNTDTADAPSPFFCGYAWTTAAEHTSEQRLPDYANPQSELYDPTIAGYGHIIKKGTIVTKTAEEGNPGQLYSNYKAFVYEGDALPCSTIVDYKGHPEIRTVVSDEIVNYEIGGISKSALYTFESADESEFKSFEKNILIGGAQFVVNYSGASRTGLYNIVKSPATNNKYLTHTHYYTEGMSAQNAYLSIKNAESPTVSADELFPASGKNISSYYSYAIDMDMMSPNANVVDGTYIQFVYHSWGAENGTRKSLIQSYATIYFSGNDSLTKISTDADRESVEVSLDAGKWFHITAILQIPTDKDANPDPSKLSDTVLALYINGEHIHDFTSIFDAKYNYFTESEYYHGEGTENAFIDEVRIGFPTSNAENSMNGETTSFDNILLRNFEKTEDEGSIANYYKRFTRPEDIPSKIVTIRWEDAEGNKIDEKKVPSYTRISHPVLDKSAINDYYAAYDSWMLDGNPVTESIFAPSDDMTFVKGARVIANFSNIHYNLSLEKNPALYFYVPVSFVDGKISSVSFDSISSGEAKITRKDKKYSIGSTEYYRYEMHIGYLGIDIEQRVSVNYKVVYNGETYSVSRNFKANALTYCNAVLSDTSGTYSKEEKTHIANLLRFANSYSYIKNGESSDELCELAETYKTTASPYDTDLLMKSDTNVDHLGEYVKSIRLRILEGKIQYVIEFRNFSYATVKGIELSEYNDDKTTSLGCDSDLTSYSTHKGSNYCSVYTTEAIDFADAFGKIEITLNVEDSKETITGSYDIATWYNNATLDGDAENWAELLYSMKALGDSQK